MSEQRCRRAPGAALMLGGGQAGGAGVMLGEEALGLSSCSADSSLLQGHVLSSTHTPDGNGAADLGLVCEFSLKGERSTRRTLCQAAASPRRNSSAGRLSAPEGPRGVPPSGGTEGGGRASSP